ncbi:MAG: M23 family metallopeptidase [Actinobacteria bacterium]|nr:M23 family metallopeptidase [Actinomycetota bacterium]
MRSRRKFALSIALTAALASTLLLPVRPAAAQAAGTTRAICFPVEGSVSYTDTWGAPRSGGRTHQGTDLMGSKMQKLLSTVDGTVVRLSYQNTSISGNYVYIRDADGWVYVYLHMNNDRPGTDDGQASYDQVFAPGLEVGTKVAAGEFIGYLGDSGNAEDAGAHLHFELHQPSTATWGTAINPYPSVRGAWKCPTLPAGTGEGLTTAWRPFATPTSFVQRQTADFFGRAPQGTELATYTGMFDNGSQGAAVIDRVMRNPRVYDTLNPIVRMYAAWLGRRPTMAEFEVARNLAWSGVPVDKVASRMLIDSGAKSLTTEEFATQLIENATGRPITSAELDFVVALRRQGYLMSQLVVAVSEAAQFRSDTAPLVRLTVTYGTMRDRMPDDNTTAKWLGRTSADLAHAIVTSDEYRRRVS